MNIESLFTGARVKIVNKFTTNPPYDVKVLGGHIVTITAIDGGKIYAEELHGTYFVIDEIECFEDETIDPPTLNVMEIL